MPCFQQVSHFHVLSRQQLDQFISKVQMIVFSLPAIGQDPMKGDPYVWSRVVGDTLTVYALLIDEDGGYEMQEYNRTLTEKGLHLEYERVRNGEKLKTITADLIRDN